MHATDILTQSSLIPKNIQFERAFVPGETCRYCDALAEPCVTPPLCALHLDLVIIISTLQKCAQPVNTANALAVLRRGLANNGEWTLTEETLPELFADFIQQTRHQSPPSGGSGGPGEGV